MRVRPHEIQPEFVARQDRGNLDQELDRVASAVGARGGRGDVAYRPREKVRVRRKQRRGEADFETHALLLEAIGGPCRGDAQVLLRHRRNRLRFAANPAKHMPIDSRQSRERLRYLRPMAGEVSRQTVGHRPDAEVGIVSDEWNCRRTDGLRVRCQRNDACP